MKRKAGGCLIVLITVACIVACPTNPPNYPSKAIELKYYAPGPWPVTVSTGGACCDSLHNKFDLYYPTTLGANGFMHPILTWGNGSFASPIQYDYFLRHMASWGFVVIATEDQQTGTGQTMLDAANFMVHANSDPASTFFHKLNVSHIGAFGHSQGAGARVTLCSSLPARSRPLSLSSFRRRPGARSGRTVSTRPTLLRDRCSSSMDRLTSPYLRLPSLRRQLANNRSRPSTTQPLAPLVSSRERSLAPTTTTSKANRIARMPRFPASTACTGTSAIRRLGSWINCKATLSRMEHL